MNNIFESNTVSTTKTAYNLLTPKKKSIDRKMIFQTQCENSNSFMNDHVTQIFRKRNDFIELQRFPMYVSCISILYRAQVRPKSNVFLDEIS